MPNKEAHHITFAWMGDMNARRTQLTDTWNRLVPVDKILRHQEHN